MQQNIPTAIPPTHTHALTLALWFVTCGFKEKKSNVVGCWYRNPIYKCSFIGIEITESYTSENKKFSFQKDIEHFIYPIYVTM